MSIYIPANGNQNVFRWTGNIKKCSKACNGSGKNPSNASQSFKKAADTRTYLEMIQDKMQDLYEKVKNGETETSYAIGGQSFTEREWNCLLENFDRMEECIRKSIEEEVEKRKEREEREEEIQDKLEEQIREEEFWHSILEEKDGI